MAAEECDQKLHNSRADVVAIVVMDLPIAACLWWSSDIFLVEQFAELLTYYQRKRKRCKLFS